MPFFFNLLRMLQNWYLQKWQIFRRSRKTRVHSANSGVAAQVIWLPLLTLEIVAKLCDNKSMQNEITKVLLQWFVIDLWARYLPHIISDNDDNNNNLRCVYVSWSKATQQFRMCTQIPRLIDKIPAVFNVWLMCHY